MVITANASTLFARLLAGAITLMFFTYAFVNMGMVSGILPVVGVPLPLVSLRRHRAGVAVHRARHPDERAGAPQARRNLTLGARSLSPASDALRQNSAVRYRGAVTLPRRGVERNVDCDDEPADRNLDRRRKARRIDHRNHVVLDEAAA